MPKQLICKKCGCTYITYTPVAVTKKAGCLTVLFYIFLAMTVLGWAVLIPILLRRETETEMYACCTSCGYKWKC